MKSTIQIHGALWDLVATESSIETATSIIQSVESPFGPAVLKCLKPVSDEFGAADLLVFFDGHGSVRLLQHSPDALLLERIDGPPLSTLVRDGRDDEAARILADVVRRLHAPRQTSPPAELMPMARWFRPLLERTESGNPLEAKAARTIARLLATTPEAQPLHGDIHHDNILLHPERGWLAIDPKGLLGNRHHDLANALCNPMQFPEIVRAPSRLVAQAKILTAELGLDLDRLLRFTFCHAALATIWCEEDGEDPSFWRELTAEVLRSAT